MKTNKFWVLAMSLFASFVFCTACLAASKNLNPIFKQKLGKPTMDEMKMSTCTVDPEASAVVLMQSCDVIYTMNSFYDMYIVYDAKIRIKVLKEEGKKYGDFIIPFYDDPVEKRQEQFYEVYAASSNLNEAGKIVTTQLSDKMLHYDRVNGHTKVLKFSVPQVQVGSVIEVHYRLYSPRFFFIYDYDMQRDIPILAQRYTMNIPAVLQFNVAAPLKNIKVKSNVSTDQLPVPGGTGNQRCSTNFYELEAYNMNAICKDEFVWNEKDYVAKVCCDLRETRFPNHAIQRYGNDWSEADKLILSQDEIGPRLNDKSKLKEEVALSGISAIADEKEKIAAAVRFLSSHIVWNGDFANIPESASSVLKKKSGTSADVNMMLINVFNDLGIKSYPVYLSTRRHGCLPIHASANAFNTFVVAVETSNGTCYVDGTDPYGGINVLRSNLYVTKGRKLGKDIAGSWVDLTQLALHKTSSTTKLVLSNDGTMSGHWVAHYSNNAAREVRYEYHDAKDSTAYVQSLQEKYAIAIDSLQMTNLYAFDKEVISQMKFQKSVDMTDDHIYINPYTFNPMGESPFKAETRELPIEFPYPSHVSYVVDLDIPEGYEVEETPKSYEVSVPDRSLIIKMTCIKTEYMVRVRFSFTSKKMVFPAEEYTTVKEVYDIACQKMTDMIVLKKK